MRIMHGRTARGIHQIAEKVQNSDNHALWWITDTRSTLGWRLGNLGNALARLGNRLDEGVPTVDDCADQYAEGYRDGHRVGVSGAMDLMLAAKAATA